MTKFPFYRGFTLVATFTCIVVFVVSAKADVFNMPGGNTSLQFVTVGNPGNPADTTVMNDGTTGYGSVPYVYQMGEYDVTLAQYTQFLNAVAKTDPYGLYNGEMVNGGTILRVGISQSGSPGSYSYAVIGSNPQAGNMPVFDVTWGDAARFCNWLDNGQPTAPEGNGTTETGAYTMNRDTTNLNTETRNAGAKYVIPTENEWYKAAYYDPLTETYWTYPTQSNTAPNNLLSSTGTNNANCYNGSFTDTTTYLTPVGYFADSPGPYATYDMGGDISQWNEADIEGAYRGYRGGAFIYPSSDLASSNRNGLEPTAEEYDVGFRVASVPEPGSIALLLAGGSCLLAFAWRRRKQAA